MHSRASRSMYNTTFSLARWTFFRHINPHENTYALILASDTYTGVHSVCAWACVSKATQQILHGIRHRALFQIMLNSKGCTRHNVKKQVAVKLLLLYHTCHAQIFQTALRYTKNRCSALHPQTLLWHRLLLPCLARKYMLWHRLLLPSLARKYMLWHRLLLPSTHKPCFGTGFCYHLLPENTKHVDNSEHVMNTYHDATWGRARLITSMCAPCRAPIYQ